MRARSEAAGWRVQSRTAGGRRLDAEISLAAQTHRAAHQTAETGSRAGLGAITLRASQTGKNETGPQCVLWSWEETNSCRKEYLSRACRGWRRN